MGYLICILLFIFFGQTFVNWKHMFSIIPRNHDFSPKGVNFHHQHGYQWRQTYGDGAHFINNFTSENQAMMTFDLDVNIYQNYHFVQDHFEFDHFEFEHFEL